MTSIGKKIMHEAVETVWKGGVVGACGAGLGYLYGQLADLPASQVAKAWAVWCVANVAIQSFINTWIDDLTTRLFAHTVSAVAVTTIGIQECRKRGLLGDKMMKFIIVTQSLAVVVNLLAIVGINVFGTSKLTS